MIFMIILKNNLKSENYRRGNINFGKFDQFV